MLQNPHCQIYHYVNPESSLNDPNGLCFWQDRWHLFYQAYPPEDPRQHWGHAVSTDLIHWSDHPYCIYPYSVPCSCIEERHAQTDGTVDSPDHLVIIEWAIVPASHWESSETDGRGHEI